VTEYENKKFYKYVHQQIQREQINQRPWKGKEIYT